MGPTSELTVAAGASDTGASRVFSSPLARRLATEAGLSISDISGSGPGGRVVRRDVEEAARGPKNHPFESALGIAATAPEIDLVTVTAGATSTLAGSHEDAPHSDTPHSQARREIAARLTESIREAPHFYLRGTACVDKLLKLRARLNDSRGGSGRQSGNQSGAPSGRHSGDPLAVTVSLNDLVVKAASRAHVLVPEMNVIWTPEVVRSFSAVDISVAVATDRGLVTPVLRRVDQMTLSAVATASSDLVARAWSGHLQQDELEGGTLTVTSLGMFGTEDFAAIINPPQSAILAVGAATRRPVVTKGRLKIGTVMSFTLSVDHRPIDGQTAAQWMAAFIALLEEPVRILV
jgi:pyruvate dehydrogenase E2 component (dihydrolipoamide acetyltransferase)